MGKFRWCDIIGHKWDESKPPSTHPRQNCLRKNCYAHRDLFWNRFPKIGEPSIHWVVIDINKIINTKLP